MPLLVCEAAGHVPADLVVALPPARALPIGALWPSSPVSPPYHTKTHRGEVIIFNNKDAPKRLVMYVIHNSLCFNNPYHLQSASLGRY